MHVEKGDMPLRTFKVRIIDAHRRPNKPDDFEIVVRECESPRSAVLKCISDRPDLFPEEVKGSFNVGYVVREIQVIE